MNYYKKKFEAAKIDEENERIMTRILSSKATHNNKYLEKSYIEQQKVLGLRSKNKQPSYSKIAAGISKKNPHKFPPLQAKSRMNNSIDLLPVDSTAIFL